MLLRFLIFYLNKNDKNYFNFLKIELGYISLHVIDLLLREGHKVRGTVRNVNDEQKMVPIKKLAAKNPAQLELVEADCLNADSWKDVVKDIDIVLHVASPFPLSEPENEDDVIKPAIEGTLNVMKASVLYKYFYYYYY